MPVSPHRCNIMASLCHHGHSGRVPSATRDAHAGVLELASKREENDAALMSAAGGLMGEQAPGV